jgi:Zn-dependent protease with chaperone function
MDGTEYRALVERERARETRNPRLHAARVEAYLWLGRLFPLLLSSTLLAVVAGFVAAVVLGPHALALFAKFFLLLLVPVAVIVRAAFVSVPRPEGLVASRSDAPHLWERIDRIAATVGTRAPDHLLYNADFNASIASRPRALGLGYSTWLTLGEPLLRCLDPDHLDAVLAHELAHLRRGDGRLGARVYRTQLALTRMVDALQEREGARGTTVLLRFYEWYMPRFAAMGHALRYRHEVDADRAAAAATSPRLHAEALAMIELRAQRYEHVELKSALVAILDDASGGEGVLPASPRGEIAALAATTVGPLTTRGMRLSLAQSLLRPQPDLDEHPTLATRMELAGFTPPASLERGLVDPLGFRTLAEAVEAPLRESSWDALVARDGRLAAGAIDVWRDRDEPGRRARFQTWARSARDRLLELDEALAAGTIRASGFPEYVFLAMRAGRELDVVAAALRDQVDRDPTNPYARLELARLLAVTPDGADHTEALGHFEAVGEQVPTLRPVALAGLRALHLIDGEAASFQRVHETFRLAVEEFERAQGERARPFGDDDEFIDAALDGERRDRVTGVLSTIPFVRTAWLTRRRHATYPEHGGDFVVLLDRDRNLSDSDMQALQISVGDAMRELYRDVAPMEDWSNIDGIPEGLETVVERMRSCADELTLSVDELRPAPIRSYAQLQDRLAAGDGAADVA